ncbi:MAG: hypothetical protein LUE92_12140, partial [Clostridiales bacterium]|nr:hypothetical protein [Clostridiales bacterium]
TWIYPDAMLSLTEDDPEILKDSYDAVVLEVDRSDSVREASIKIVTGEPDNSPEYPEMESSDEVHQYPLAYIYRTAEATEITDSDITSMIGTDDTPFVTGILEVVSLDTLLGQWRSELDQFVESEETELTEQYDALVASLAEKTAEIDAWKESEESSFQEWFSTIKGILGDDSAGNLQNEIDEAEIERILMVGLTDGVKTFSDDGLIITTVDTSGRTLTKTFASDFLSCEVVLKNSSSVVIATMSKTFAADGSTISTTVTIV